MAQNCVLKASFTSVHPMYVTKAEREDHTKEEVDEIICWLTGYSRTELEEQLQKQVTLERFFARAPALNPSRSLITGVACGVWVEDIEDSLVEEIRYLDKVIDGLAKGEKMEKILRK